MREEQVTFTAGRLSIEGLFAGGDGTRAAVVTHPHSLMGGSMMNNVVDAMVEAFLRKGISTLRFNFRGVGRSGGSFDNGIGEQDDVKGALEFLGGKGFAGIILSGYSFGAWVNSKVASASYNFTDVIMVSPPLDFLAFDFDAVKGKCGLIICGDRDQFCPIGRLTKEAEAIGAVLRIVRGADHFYFGMEEGIVDYISDYLES